MNIIDLRTRLRSEQKQTRNLMTHIEDLQDEIKRKNHEWGANKVLCDMQGEIAYKLGEALRCAELLRAGLRGGIWGRDAEAVCVLISEAHRAFTT